MNGSEALTVKPRITLLTLGVDDLERSVAFYRDGLTLPTKGIVGREYEHGAVAFFDLQAGLKLALWSRDDLAHDTGIHKSARSSTEFSIGQKRVRAAIRKALPQADESISYRIPTYKLSGRPVIYFGGFTQHYSIYPANARLVAAFKRELEDRLSDSPFVERIWRSHSERAGEFLSVAAPHWEMAVTRHRGQTFLTVRGPETRATTADCPADGEWLGIRFKLGTFWPQFPPATLRDRRDVTLPGASARSFWLNGSAWEYPDFENADVFVARLVRKGVIARDSSVDAVLRGERPVLSLRSAQRHFLRATGIRHAAFRTIERARIAANLLRDGVPVLDVIDRAGYFDQPHLTRSLRLLIGQTPAPIARGTRQLSFLYKTTPSARFYDAGGRNAMIAAEGSVEASFDGFHGPVPGTRALQE
jgi:catechol 2,3-dioxygenase-like lactoylglutathione lyase family enzyme